MKKYRVPTIDEFVDGFEFEVSLRFSDQCFAAGCSDIWLEQNPDKTWFDYCNGNKWFKVTFRNSGLHSKDIAEHYVEVEELYGNYIRVEVNE